MRKIKYKVLNKNMSSPFKGMKYDIGRRYICKDFDEDNSKGCSQGFYATDIEGLLYCYDINRSIYECLVGGKSVEFDIFKQRYSTIEIVREVSIDEVKQIIKERNLSKELGYDLEHALFPVNPLLINRSKHITEEEKQLLQIWASVWASVEDSVEGSMKGSVWSSVWSSVRDSVEGSVRSFVGEFVGGFVGGSVWISVYAYTSSLFFRIKKWKNFDSIKGENPFQSCIDLWHLGLVPSYVDGIWRLHAGKKAEIIYEYKP